MVIIREKTKMEITKNTLFYGDNLKILREHIDDNSIELIYLDPPFNSKATYNFLFKEATYNGLFIPRLT